MSESIVLSVVAAAVFLQLLISWRDREAGVSYYLAVGSLSYFSVWVGASWTLDRLCGVIVFCIPHLRRRLSAPQKSHMQDSLMLLILYSTVITVAGMLLWPVGAVKTDSSVYGTWRGLVQLVNWGIVLAVATELRTVFSRPGALRRITVLMSPLVVAICAYAGYQWIAVPRGWPSTGIRRPMERIAADGIGEQYAAFSYSGADVFRPGSLVGEPKGLGGACVMWLALLSGETLQRRPGKATIFTFSSILGALFLTFSTSAWAGAALGLALYLHCYLRVYGGGRALRDMAIACMTGLFVLYVVDVKTITDMIALRTTVRLSESGPLADLSEISAIAVLSEDPVKALTGVGLGGMSFYIAEALGDDGGLVLFPNNGLLGLVCNVGIVGTFFLWLLVRRSVLLVMRASFVDVHSLSLAYAGTVILGQCLIHGGLQMWGIGLGCLMSSEHTRDEEGL